MTYGYDSVNRLTSVTDWNPNATPYAYYDANRMTTTTLPSGTGIVSTNSDDNAARLTAISHVKGGSTTIASVSPVEVVVGIGMRALLIDALRPVPDLRLRRSARCRRRRVVVPPPSTLDVRLPEAVLVREKREMSGVRRVTLDFLAWLYQMPGVELRSDEAVLEDSAAWLLVRRSSLRGRLILTTHRLVFQQMQLRPLGVDIQPIDLALGVAPDASSNLQVKKRTTRLELRAGMPGVGSFSVESDDWVLDFQAPQADTWVAAISAAIAQARSGR